METKKRFESIDSFKNFLSKQGFSNCVTLSIYEGYFAQIIDGKDTWYKVDENYNILPY